MSDFTLTSNPHPITATVVPNQILVNFRFIKGSEKEGAEFLVNMELNAIKRGSREYFTTQEQQHAQAVLERWLNVYGAVE